ncbi:MAG: hypothetical protein AB8G16_08795 [Gammaproteobacteria bacterium]
MTKPPTLECAVLLDRVAFLLDYASRAYRQYMASGKKFLFASILYATNDDIRRSLMHNIQVLPADKRSAAMELIYHIDVWQRLWEEERVRRQPDNDDVFAFENDVTFPTEQVERLLRRKNSD